MTIGRNVLELKVRGRRELALLGSNQQAPIHVQGRIKAFTRKSPGPPCSVSPAILFFWLGAFMRRVDGGTVLEGANVAFLAMLKTRSEDIFAAAGGCYDG